MSLWIILLCGVDRNAWESEKFACIIADDVMWDDFFMFQSFMNLWQDLIGMGSLERRGFGALHGCTPSFWGLDPPLRRGNSCNIIFWPLLCTINNTWELSANFSQNSHHSVNCSWKPRWFRYSEPMTSHARSGLYRLFAKWRHGRHLESMTSYPETDFISVCVFDAYSLEEQSRQISFRSDLKLWSLRLFVSGRPNKNKKHKMSYDMGSGTWSKNTCSVHACH